MKETLMLSLNRPLMTTCWLVVGAILSLSTAATAIAAPTLELTRAATEPVESITTQLGAVVDNGGGDDLFFHLKPLGGEACGANVSADRGEAVASEAVSSASDPANVSNNWTFHTAGTYRICGWL